MFGSENVIHVDCTVKENTEKQESKGGRIIKTFSNGLRHVFHGNIVGTTPK